MMKPVVKAELKNALLIFLGLIFCTLAYNQFLIPNNIAAGGFTGISQLINHFTGWRVGLVALAMNVPLFLVSMKSLGLPFGIRSLIASIAFSLMLDGIPPSCPIDDMWLSTVYGGLLSGIGFGLILRGNATTGGTDMLSSLIHRLIPAIRVSTGLCMIDGLVVLASVFVFDTTAAMYALICVVITNIVVDFVLEGPNSSHSYFIISDKSEEIAQQVMAELDRGVTALEGRGMYSGNRKQVLYCVVSRMESVRLRRIVFAIDPRAFLTSSLLHDAFGEGFKDYQK